jgi:hypothetical protein
MNELKRLIINLKLVNIASWFVRLDSKVNTIIILIVLDIAIGIFNLIK